MQTSVETVNCQNQWHEYHHRGSRGFAVKSRADASEKQRLFHHIGIFLTPLRVVQF